MDIGGIILAGGKSRRFGQNKCLLKINNTILVKIVAATLAKICSDVIVVAKEQEPYSVASLPVVTDSDNRQLPLIGILTGLKASNYEKNIIVACDMPFLHPDSLQLLIDNADGADAVVPVIDKRTEPLHALYSKNCVPLIEELTKEEDLRISSVFDKAQTKYLKQEIFEVHDPELLSFYNINSEEDYRKALLIEQANKK